MVSSDWHILRASHLHVWLLMHVVQKVDLSMGMPCNEVILGFCAGCLLIRGHKRPDVDSSGKESAIGNL